MSVLVVTEHSGPNWSRVSFETAAAGQALAAALNLPVDAAVLGHELGNLPGELARYPFQRVYALDHPLLANYTPDGFTSALEQLVRTIHPAVVLFPHTYQVRDYAPKLAARFDQLLITDVVHLAAAEGKPVFTRQLFQGKLHADVRSTSERGPAFASVQAGAFRSTTPAESDAAAIEPFTVTLAPDQIRSRPDPPFRDSQRTVDLSAAEVIVSVGRGIKEKENLPLVEDLARVLGAELAASRPICDNGWLAMERQVGSSGQTVSPKMYVAVGISGAIQHLVGMKSAKTIVAINKDESAPIFEVANYGVVGDLFEIVPALIEELKKTQS